MEDSLLKTTSTVSSPTCTEGYSERTAMFKMKDLL